MINLDVTLSTAVAKWLQTIDLEYVSSRSFLVFEDLEKEGFEISLNAHFAMMKSRHGAASTVKYYTSQRNNLHVNVIFNHFFCLQGSMNLNSDKKSRG